MAAPQPYQAEVWYLLGHPWSQVVAVEYNSSVRLIPPLMHDCTNSRSIAISDILSVHTVYDGWHVPMYACPSGPACKLILIFYY